MKIRDMAVHVVNMGHRNIPYVTVDTDEGLQGIGEAYSCGPDLATAHAIEDFKAWLVGRDPRDVEGLWQLMYAGSRFPGGMVLNAAISGIEHALWDIAGQAAGLPAYRLMGGRVRDKVRVYQSVSGDDPEALADNARALLATYGYTMLKMNPLPADWHRKPWGRVLREAEARVAAVRDAIGPDADIGLDPHARIFEIGHAAQLCDVVAPYRPMFVEEPLRPENAEALGVLRRKASVPLATGEMLYTRHQFLPLLQQHAVDFIQPDVCVTGGLWEMKKIAAMAEVHYVSVAPHNPCGPVANAVNAHFAASTHNFAVLEYRPDDAGVRRRILQEPVPLRDGYLEIPERPGLGVEFNADILSSRSTHFMPWRRPQPWREDGSLAYQ